MIGSSSPSVNGQTSIDHAMLQNRPVWCIDHAYSIGHTVDDSGRGIVPSLDTKEYPSVDKAVKALNAGTVSCPNGLCIVRSERQKLYFLVARSDKLHECANTARDVLNVKKAEQPFPGVIDSCTPALKTTVSLPQDVASVHVEPPEVSVADDGLGDDTVLRAHTRSSSENELDEPLSKLRRVRTTLENVASERREHGAATRSTQDRTERANRRSLRRSGTAYENEPVESCADENVSSERREDVVPIRRTQDRTEWAKKRLLRRSGTAYENEPAESHADVNAEIQRPVDAFAAFGA